MNGHSKQRYRCQLFWVITLFFVSFLASADTSSVNFIVVKKQGIYNQIVELAMQSIQRDGLAVRSRIFEIDELGESAPKLEGRLVTIGTQAAAYAYQHYPEKAMVNALLTRSGFAELAQHAFGSLQQVAQKDINPLYLDQPLARFLALGSMLVPAAKTVGILVGPANSDRLEVIKRQAAESGFDVNIALLDPNSNPIKVIEPVVKVSDFFVVLADRKQINQLAAKWVLPLSYRYKKPVVAYSRKYVDAGALASLYLSPEDVALSIIDALKTEDSYSATHSLRFSVAINSSVARSLAIAVKDPQTYAAELRSREISR